MLRNLSGRSVLVTGGASGLGEAVARYLVTKHDAKVTILDMNEDHGNKVVADLGPENCQFVKTDVTNPDQVNHAIQLNNNKFKTLYGAVSCAGICPAAKVVGKKGAHPLDVFAKTINVNLIGTFNVARLAASQMASQEPDATGERGIIINTASIAAFEGQIGQAAYSASKGGVVALTLPMARELAANGIRVNTVAPGIMKTPMLAGLPQPAQDSLAQQVPFPSRLGSPEEFGALVAFIMQNQYINGEVIRIDGSLRMGAK